MYNKIIKNFTDDVKNTNDTQLYEIAFAYRMQLREWTEHREAFEVYPIVYRVTGDQITEAKEELQKRKKEEIKKYKDELLFINMGMSFEPKIWFIWNHRVRTFFLDNQKKKCFIEVWTSTDKNIMSCDFIGRHNEYNSYNAKKAHKINDKKIKFTEKNLINLINETFYTNYKSIYFSDILNHKDIDNMIKEL